VEIDDVVKKVLKKQAFNERSIRTSQDKKEKS